MTSEPAAEPRYENSCFADRHDGQLARLQTLEHAFDPLSKQTLTALNLSEAPDILDIGAGAGSIVSWLLTHRPQAVITAVDIDTRFLTGLPGIRVLECDVVTGTFPAESVDLVHARALLSHVRERDRVLARAEKWVRPGGWVVIEDICLHPSLETTNQLFRTVAEAGVTLLETTVGSDMKWAHTLPERLCELGLTEVGHRAVVGCIGDDSPADAFWLSTVDQAEPALVRQGILAQSDLDAMRALRTQPDFVEPALTLVSAWGRVPGPMS